MAIDAPGLTEWFKHENWLTGNLADDKSRINESKAVKIISEQTALCRKQENHSRALEIINRAQMLGLASPWLEQSKALSLAGTDENGEAYKIWQKLASLDDHPKLRSLAQEALKDAEDSEPKCDTTTEIELINTLQNLAAEYNWTTQCLPPPNQQLKNIDLDQFIIEEANLTRKNNFLQLSLDIVNTAIAAGNDNPWMLDCRARALSALEQFDEAHQIWSKLSQMDNRPALLSSVKTSIEESTQRQQAINETIDIDAPGLTEWFKQENWLTGNLVDDKSRINESKAVKIISEQTALCRKQENHSRALEIINRAQMLGLASPWLEQSKALSLAGTDENGEAYKIWQKLASLDDHPKLRSLAQEALKDAEDSEPKCDTTTEIELINTLQNLAAEYNWTTQCLPPPNQQLKNIDLDQFIIEEANLTRKNNFLQLSLDIVNTAIAAGNDNPWMLDCRARALSALEQFDEAHQIWSKLSQMDNRPALLSSVKTSIEESTQRQQTINTERSTRLLLKLHELAEQELWTLRHLPNAERLTKDFDLTTPIIEESIELLKNNKPNLSLELLEEALKNHLSSPWLDHNKAKTLICLENFEEAELILQNLAMHTDKPKLAEASKDALKDCKRKFAIHQAIKLKSEGRFLEAINLLNINQLTYGINPQAEDAIKAIIRQDEESRETRNSFFENAETQEHYIQLKASEKLHDLVESLQ